MKEAFSDRGENIQISMEFGVFGVPPHIWHEEHDRKQPIYARHFAGRLTAGQISRAFRNEQGLIKQWGRVHPKVYTERYSDACSWPRYMEAGRSRQTGQATTVFTWCGGFALGDFAVIAPHPLSFRNGGNFNRASVSAARWRYSFPVARRGFSWLR